jgi:ubiquinone/menaquinone biosynthesis C-methylase UbiE
VTVAADHAREAYDALAPGYDALTAHHDHEAWTATLLERAEAAGLRGRRLLDVACGTGNTLVPMVARGFCATGVDVSEAMLAEAGGKLPPDVRLVAGDMRALPALGQHDLVWSLGDACNYLQTYDELVQAFEGFRRNVGPDGVVVIDVNTLATFRRLYSSLLVMPERERVVIVEGQGDPGLASGGAAIAWVDRLEPGDDGWWIRTRSVHHHRHHAPETIRAALAAAGLACEAELGAQITGALERPLDELRHTKAVYIARPRRVRLSERR